MASDTASPDIGVLVVAHGNLAAGLLSAAHEILGELSAIGAVHLDAAAEHPREVLAAAVAGADRGAGVLVLTDLFGGTPSNVALALGHDHVIEVVTGVNLAMVLRALSRRRSNDLKTLAADVAEYGRRQILEPHALLAERMPG